MKGGKHDMFKFEIICVLKVANVDKGVLASVPTHGFSLNFA